MLGHLREQIVDLGAGGQRGGARVDDADAEVGRGPRGLAEFGRRAIDVEVQAERV